MTVLSEKENWLRAIEFRGPERIPCSVSLSISAWHHYREELEDLVLAHPLIFGDFQRGEIDFDGFPPGYAGKYRDNWGCLWHTPDECIGLEGQVIESPLSDWDAFDTYSPPDIETKRERGNRDWKSTAEGMRKAKEDGLLCVGYAERLFDRLYFLRGFENLMVDIGTDDSRLPKLIDMLLEYERELVQHWLDMDVDAVKFHTDIGMQHALMISPEQFRKYIKPMFKELFGMCREAGAHVLLSSDGRILEIVDDLIECGVTLHDPQLRANTLDGIVAAYKGRMCVDVDLDRQMFPFCTPQDIRQQVEDVVKALGDPEGGRHGGPHQRAAHR